MVVYDLEGYRQLQARRLAAYSRNTSRGKILGAEKFAARLRMYVPQNTGKLRRSINRKGGVVRIGATGTKGFPYLHWINQTSPEFVTLNVKPKGPTGATKVNINGRWVNVIGGRMTYGLEPSNWKWTGRVGFVKIALYETRQDWQVLMQRVNKKSIIGESI